MEVTAGRINKRPGIAATQGLAGALEGGVNRYGVRNQRGGEEPPQAPRPDHEQTAEDGKGASAGGACRPRGCTDPAITDIRRGCPGWIGGRGSPIRSIRSGAGET